MVNPFASTEGKELIQHVYPDLRWFAKGLLTPGCYILASKPKLGKSFWCLQLAVALTSGQPFLDRFETAKTGICLLQLEDGLQRAQRRLWLIADEVEDGLRLVEEANRLDNGLLEQIDSDLQAHPDTGVYVIDTFAAVRPPDAEYSYQVDYQHSKTLADFATAHGVCIILVHHCRKAAGFGDSFDNISGTNGLTAGATGMIVLAKDERDPGKVIMTAKGKDIEETAFRMEFSRHRWSILEPLTQEDIRSYSIPECVIATVHWMSSAGGKWSGSTSELLKAVGLSGLSAISFGKFLAQHRSFMLDYGINYARHHVRGGSHLTLTCEEMKPDAPEQ